MRLAAALGIQIALLGWAVGERLLPRVSGDEYRIRVQPVDPIDPFRGAYVDLDYGLRGGPEGRVYVVLARDGDAWRAARTVRARPGARPYLRCVNRDYRVRCGIESLFASQDEARRLEQELAGGAVARVKIDGAGRAAIVGLD